MSDQSAGDDGRGRITRHLGGVVGKTLLFVVALWLLGNLLAYLAIESSVLTYTPFISLLVGMLYSLALVVLVVLIVASILAYLH